MKKTSSYIYCLIFLVLLILPAAFLNTEKNVRSELDNRYLAEYPERGSETFTADLEAYFKDRVGFRNQMIHGYDVINDALFNELTHPTYTYGKDGYVFFNMHNNIPYGDYHKTFAEAVLKIQNYVESRGSHFYFIFEPEKLSVYRQYLPAGVYYNDEWVDRMLGYMEELGVNCVDSGKILREKAGTEQVFDRKYDAGHWNDLGQFYATNQLLERIHEDIPAVGPLRMHMFEVKQVNAEYLKNSEFTINESVPNFELKVEYDDETEKWAGSVKRNPTFTMFYYYVNKSAGASSLPKMLIFQGSYYNRHRDYFVPVSSECIGVHNYQNVLDIGYYYSIFQPDVVILDAAEYVLTNYYFNRANMKALALKPALDSGASWTELSMEARVNVSAGEVVDSISVSIPVSNVNYAWLVCGDTVLDLSSSDGGTFAVKTGHGLVDKGADCDIYVSTSFGGNYVLHTKARDMEDLVSEPACSANASWEDGAVTFTTSIDDNCFNSLEVQLYSADRKAFIKLINRRDQAGTASFNYLHENSSGLYCIRVKANSNKKDEYADYLIYLEQGERYSVSYDMNSISEKRIEIDSFRFFGPAVE